MKKSKKNKKKVSMQVNVTDEAINYLKTIFIVFTCFLLIYGIVMLLDKKGVFDRGYEAPQLSEAEISYDYILAGTMFNRQDSEYYVVFDKFNTKDENVFLKYILNSASVETPIYKVNMNVKVNKQYFSDTSNPKVQNVNDLKIKGVTLIKIKNGKNVLYLDAIEKIKAELIK